MACNGFGWWILYENTLSLSNENNFIVNKRSKAQMQTDCVCFFFYI